MSATDNMNMCISIRNTTYRTNKKKERRRNRKGIKMSRFDHGKMEHLHVQCTKPRQDMKKRGGGVGGGGELVIHTGLISNSKVHLF